MGNTPSWLSAGLGVTSLISGGLGILGSIGNALFGPSQEELNQQQRRLQQQVNRDSLLDKARMEIAMGNARTPLNLNDRYSYQRKQNANQTGTQYSPEQIQAVMNYVMPGTIGAVRSQLMRTQPVGKDAARFEASRANLGQNPGFQNPFVAPSRSQQSQQMQARLRSAQQQAAPMFASLYGRMADRLPNT